MIPVILCGGYSSRMGEDKGLMLWRGLPMAARMIKIVEDKCNTSPIISIRQEQADQYATIFPTVQMIMDDVDIHIGGPLKGILSVHNKWPDEDLFLVACDMPLLSDQIIDKIKQAFAQHLDKEIIVCQHDLRIEPLCGIYSGKGLQKIIQSMQHSDHHSYSMMYWIDLLNSMILEVSDKDAESFLNLNRKEDL